MPDVTPDEPPRPLSVVLFGYGLAGRVFHGPLLRATPALSLDAIVTSDPGRQTQARADHPTADVLDSADDVWDRPFDLAVVATANVTHVPLATRSIEAGMSVVVDKPVGPTAASVRDLAEHARANRVLLVPFHNRGLDSDFLTVLRHEDAIGTIHRFESRIERFRLVPKGGWRDRAESDQMGGMLYDLGPHVTYQALRLLGPARQVAAAVRIVRPESVTDDDVVVTIWHESGAVSELTVSQASVFGQPRFTVLGTRGGLQVAASDSQEAVLAGGGDPAASGWGVEPAGTEAWAVDLRGRLGPLARSKRLRMVRGTVGAEADGVRTARFERAELDGRQHSPWVLQATVAPHAEGSTLAMGLHYGGSLFGPVLERVLRDEIERSRRRLLDLVTADR